MSEQVPHAPGESPIPPQPARLAEVARLFTRLGFTAFGGPAAHLALIEDEVVTRRKWLDRSHFLDIVSAINFIPGPNSTELAIHLGYVRAGFPGLLAAGICFIAPAMLIILPIAWAYVQYGALPRVQGMMLMIGCAVVAIVAVAAWRFAAPLARNPFQRILMLACALAWAALSRWTSLQPELIVLAGAGLIGAARAMLPPPRIRVPHLMLAPLSAIVQFRLPLISIEYERGLLALCGILLKIGATLFGSGYVLVSYLRADLVTSRGWLSEQQLLDAISVGQFTPGPLLTSATFVGYLLGHGRFGGGHPGGAIGAAAATAAIFLPSFFFVAILGPYLARIRQHRIARGMLDGMNAAVAALLVIVTAQMALSSIRAGGWIGALALCAAAVALWRGINATWIILAALALGLVLPR